MFIVGIYMFTFIDFQTVTSFTIPLLMSSLDDIVHSGFLLDVQIIPNRVALASNRQFHIFHGFQAWTPIPFLFIFICSCDAFFAAKIINHFVSKRTNVQFDITWIGFARSLHWIIRFLLFLPPDCLSRKATRRCIVSTSWLKCWNWNIMMSKYY